MLDDATLSACSWSRSGSHGLSAGLMVLALVFTACDWHVRCEGSVPVCHGAHAACQSSRGEAKMAVLAQLGCFPRLACMLQSWDVVSDTLSGVLGSLSHKMTVGSCRG